MRDNDLIPPGWRAISIRQPLSKRQAFVMLVVGILMMLMPYFH